MGVLESGHSEQVWSQGRQWGGLEGDLGGDRPGGGAPG